MILDDCGPCAYPIGFEFGDGQSSFSGQPQRIFGTRYGRIGLFLQIYGNGGTISGTLYIGGPPGMGHPFSFQTSGVIGSRQYRLWELPRTEYGPIIDGEGWFQSLFIINQLLIGSIVCVYPICPPPCETF